MSFLFIIKTVLAAQLTGYVLWQWPVAGPERMQETDVIKYFSLFLATLAFRNISSICINIYLVHVDQLLFEFFLTCINEFKIFISTLHNDIKFHSFTIVKGRYFPSF